MAVDPSVHFILLLLWCQKCILYTLRDEEHDLECNLEGGLEEARDLEERMRKVLRTRTTSDNEG